MPPRLFGLLPVIVEGLLTDGAADPVPIAQRAADAVLPGQLEVVRAHHHHFLFVASVVFATYRLVEDPVAGFATEGVRADLLRRGCRDARWEVAALRRFEEAFGAEAVLAFAARQGPNRSVQARAAVRSDALADLHGEARRLAAAVEAWGGPERRRPGDSVDWYSLRLHLVPPFAAAEIPELSTDLPRSVALAEPERLRIVKRVATAATHVVPVSKRDPTPCSVWRAFEPNLTTDHLRRLRMIAFTEAQARLAEWDGSREVSGHYVTRFDGRPDRLRFYLNTRPTESSGRVESGPHPAIAVSLDLDGGNLGEAAMVTYDRGDYSLPEPDRVPH